MQGEAMNKEKLIWIPRILVSIMVLVLLVLAITDNVPLGYEAIIRYSFVLFFFILSLIAIFLPLVGGYLLQIGSMAVYFLFHYFIIDFIGVLGIIQQQFVSITLIFVPFILIGTLFIHLSRYQKVKNAEK